jgi:thioredoxin-like negative regulator of GroEL
MVPVRTRDEYLALLRSGDPPLLAQMEAPWCGDCHNALPELETIANTFRGRLTVLRLDADADSRLREEFELQGYPTYIFAESGRVTATCLGAPDFGLTRLVELLVP